MSVIARAESVGTARPIIMQYNIADMHCMVAHKHTINGAES
jgi:hypothetical protein